MAEPDESGSDPQDAPESLDKFKAALEAADKHSMDDVTHARSGIHWDPVTDAGGSPAPTDDRDDSSGFQFDLGSALARLDEPEQPAAPRAAPAPPVPAARDEPPTSDPISPPVDVAPAPPDSGVPPLQTPAPAPPADDRAADDPLASLRGLLDDSKPTPRPDPTPAAGTMFDESAPAPPATPADRQIRRSTAMPGSVFGDESIASPAPPPAAPAPAPPAAAAPPAAVAPTPAPPMPAEPEPLPEIREATSDELPTRTPSAAPGSVFADVDPNPPAPRLPGAAAAAPAPAVPNAPTPVAPAAAPAPAAPAPAVSSPSPALPGAVAPELPTLPAAPAAVTPMITEPPDSATATPDMHALRSAQLRANKQQKQGRLLGRSLLAIVLVGAAIGAALLFGRSYLFPSEWDAALTPIVDEIQESRGADFDHTVSLHTLPADQYATEVSSAFLGAGWTDDLPIWRAAGLADGEASEATVGAALSQRFPVVYSATNDTIYRLADADDAAVAAELRIVLDDIFELQRNGVVATRAAAAGEQFAGVSAMSYIAQRSVDVHASGGRSQPDSGDVATPSLPIPIQYELDAIDGLGEAVLTGANVDPSTVERGAAYPEAVAGVLDDGAVQTAGGLVRAGEESLADPTALGVDDWSLVWSAYLPTVTVDGLADILVADSFRPIERGGITCFLGVFQVANEPDGNQFFASLLRWAGAAPAGAQALATELGATRFQLEACDPGGSATGSTEDGTVADLLNRQIERLAR